MKRDFELVRKILLAAQDGNLNGPIEGYCEDELKYHRALLIDAGLAAGPQPLRNSTCQTEIPLAVTITKLTWQGHDMIDGIADDSRWQKVKDFLRNAGREISLEAIRTAVSALMGTTPR